jgi:hypothetical protein
MITEEARTRMIRVPGRKPVQHIVWTPEAEASFAEIKLKINACPKLFLHIRRLPILDYRIEHIPGVENIPADVFPRLIKPHEARTVRLNVLTRSGRGEGNDVGRGGPTEGSGAITTILHNVPEEGPASQAELGEESLQPSYSEERGTSIGMHHGPRGHFGVNKV